MDQKVLKTGNSLAVTIPSGFVKVLGIRAGDNVKVSVDANKGKMICVFAGIKQLLLSENFLKHRRAK